MTYTNGTSHEIQNNLHRAPMFTGVVKGGPRYRPSIEEPRLCALRTSEQSHQLFLSQKQYRGSLCPGSFQPVYLRMSDVTWFIYQSVGKCRDDANRLLLSTTWRLTHQLRATPGNQENLCDSLLLVRQMERQVTKKLAKDYRRHRL